MRLGLVPDGIDAMRVVTPSQTDAGPAPRWQFAARSPVLISLLSLLTGTGLVAWLTQTQALGSHASARAMAGTVAVRLEERLNSALQATESFGVFGQSDLSLRTNFQQIATRVLASEPVLVSLELEPGGVVSEVVPRGLNPRLIGLDVLTNPAQAASARAAVQNRRLTVAGPFMLQNGEPGLIARMPFFQTGRDGRQTFWGFVAGSVGFTPALRSAGLDELVTRGYNYRIFSSGRPGEAGVTVAGHGACSLEDAVGQAVPIRGVGLHLALRPRSGWVSRSQVVLESVAVLAISGLFYLLAAREEHRLTATEMELKVARQAQSQWEKQKEQFEASARQAHDTAISAQSRSKQTESELSRLQAELESSTRAAAQGARNQQAELEGNRSALVREHQEVEHLRARLEEFAEAQRKAAAAYEDQSRHDKAAVAELERRLEDAKRSARETAQTSATRLKSLEQANQELERHLQAAELRGAKVAELTALLQQAQSRLQQAEAASAAPHRPGGEAAPPLAGDSGEPVGSAVEPPHPPPEPRSRNRPAKNKRSRSERDNQIDLFAESLETREDPAAFSSSEASHDGPIGFATGGAVSPGNDPDALVQPLKNNPDPKAKERGTSRRSEEPPLIDVAEFRRAANEIVPLLVEQDPGAHDCLGGNRLVFRHAFTAEGFEEFERAISSREFGPALEQLRRCAKKHGVAV